MNDRPYEVKCRQCGVESIVKYKLLGKNLYQGRIEKVDVATGSKWRGKLCPKCANRRGADTQRANLTGSYKNLRKTMKPKKDHE